MCWQSKRFIGESAQVESSGVRQPGRTAPTSVAPSLGFYGDGSSLHIAFSQSLWFTQPRRILGGGRTRGVSIWPCLISSGWWRLISSVFLARPSCRKTSDAGGYQVPGQGGRLPSACFPQHPACGTFLDQGLNHVPCNSWWILKHWTTKEVLIIKCQKFYFKFIWNWF